MVAFDTTPTRPFRLKPPTRIGEALLERGHLTREQLDHALDLQARTGERLGRILIALGYVRRYQLYQVLADLWQYPFIDLKKARPDPALLAEFKDPQWLIDERFMPLMRYPRGVDVATANRPTPELTQKIQAVVGNEPINYYVTTEWDIDYAIRDAFRDDLLDRAVYGLYYRSPASCAYTVMTRWQFGVFALLLFGFVFGLLLLPVTTLTIFNVIVNLAFITGILFKGVISIAGAHFERVEPVTQAEVDALSDDELPTYTILVPVYKEANIVGLLMRNLASLDYPKEKIEMLLLMEEDDEETIEAARASNPPETVTFVIIPDGMPKTKPKACNVGLFFAKGEYCVIYDAEDRPEPDQLKKAVVAFRKGDDRLVCVQAALNYFNANENFLTRMFTLEYSYWFDYVLPGLDRFRLPIPLGGTSNHFRTDILRRLGAWDPFNVTEDADLGIRASSEGYTVGVINSTTYEEANRKTGNWIRQRSRWIKGYMQTVLVHTREPIALTRRVGLKNALSFLLLIAGTPLNFLAFPIMWVFYLVWLVTGTKAFDEIFPPVLLYVGLFNLLAGNGLMIYLGMLAVFKRRYFELSLFALANPIYWFMHSIAAYKALWQLFTKPFYWEKTVHGITTHQQHQQQPEPEPSRTRTRAAQPQHSGTD